MRSFLAGDCGLARGACCAALQSMTLVFLSAAPAPVSSTVVPTAPERLRQAASGPPDILASPGVLADQSISDSSDAGRASVPKVGRMDCRCAQRAAAPGCPGPAHQNTEQPNNLR